MLGHQAIISRRFIVRKLFDGTYRIINSNHGINGIRIIPNIVQNIRLVICIIHWIEQLLIMIMPHMGNILGPSFIFYSVAVSHVTGVVVFDFFPEAFDITNSKLWCQCICTLSFFIPQYLILSIFGPCFGLFHELTNNSWARLVIVTPTKYALRNSFNGWAR